MNPKEFVNTIYLGDRFCKSILIDGLNEKVRLRINVISRIRSFSGNWEYYNDENIEDGFIVFTGVESISFEPQGFIPNDEIAFVSVDPIKEKDEHFLFKLSAASCDQQGHYTEVTMRIIAKGIHLEDPSKPDFEIFE